MFDDLKVISFVIWPFDSIELAFLVVIIPDELAWH